MTKKKMMMTVVTMRRGRGGYSKDENQREDPKVGINFRTCSRDRPNSVKNKFTLARKRNKKDPKEQCLQRDAISGSLPVRSNQVKRQHGIMQGTGLPTTVKAHCYRKLKREVETFELDATSAAAQTPSTFTKHLDSPYAEIPGTPYNPLSPYPPSVARNPPMARWELWFSIA
ncbi:hypothetical protein BGX38DRAFT_1271090 [Terfezia claveryi]|nr:hypothetical protein BGX38DRAFT_1271090 [Terfezia claveryi]